MDNILEHIPTTKQERWKYTNLTSAVKHLPEQMGQADVSFKDPHGFVKPLADALNSPEIWLSALLERKPAGEDRYDDMSLWHLSNKLLRDGLLIDVPKNAICQEPIEIALKGHDQNFTSPRTIIRIAEGAELTVIERHEGEGFYWNNRLTQILVGKNAKLRHIRLQNNSLESVYTQNTHVEISRDGVYEALTFTMGSALSRNQVQVDLNDKNASCRLYGVNMLSGKQVGDTTLEVVHNACCCQSEQFYRSVMDDRARSVFQGKVYVADGAHKTDAQQLSNALMLSEGAEVDTKPELEIYDEDVKCSHGATTGQLDKGALFYLRSRGIPEEEARSLLIKAFINEVLDKFGDEKVVSAAEKSIEEWLS